MERVRIILPGEEVLHRGEKIKTWTGHLYEKQKLIDKAMEFKNENIKAKERINSQSNDKNNNYDDDPVMKAAIASSELGDYQVELISKVGINSDLVFKTVEDALS